MGLNDDNTKFTGNPHADPVLDLVLDLLNRIGFARIRVHGASMRPFICDGEIVRIRRCSIRDIRSGDIVACRHTGGLIVHRLLAKTKRLLILKGDAKFSLEKLPPDSLLGIVMTIEKDGGHINMARNEARALNIALLSYMMPISFLFHVASFLKKIKGNNDSSNPEGSSLLRAVEYAPKKAAETLISKNR